MMSLIRARALGIYSPIHGSSHDGGGMRSPGEGGEGSKAQERQLYGSAKG